MKLLHLPKHYKSGPTIRALGDHSSPSDSIKQLTEVCALVFPGRDWTHPCSLLNTCVLIDASWCRCLEWHSSNRSLCSKYTTVWKTPLTTDKTAFPSCHYQTDDFFLMNQWAKIKYKGLNSFQCKGQSGSRACTFCAFNVLNCTITGQMKIERIHKDSMDKWCGEYFWIHAC